MRVNAEKLIAAMFGLSRKDGSLIHEVWAFCLV